MICYKKYCECCTTKKKKKNNNKSLVSKLLLVLIRSINTKRELLINLELQCHSDPANQQLSNATDAIRLELKELVDQENTYWHQHSKISWMKDGDQNSKFFHAMASQRKRSNEIQKLKDSDGRWYSQQSDLERVASDYFQTMFTSASTSSVKHVINHVCEVYPEHERHFIG